MMTANRTTRLTAVGVLIGAYFVWGSRTIAEDAERTPAASKLVAAARSALEATETLYEVGQAKAEDLYTWSRRLLEAELASGANRSAAVQHVARMRKLFDRVSTLANAGAAGGEPSVVAGATFYLEEAQLLAVDAAAR